MVKLSRSRAEAAAREFVRVKHPSEQPGTPEYDKRVSVYATCTSGLGRIGPTS